MGAGKTPLALRLARSVRRGEQFLGRSVMTLPEAVRVAYLIEEPRYSFDQPSETRASGRTRASPPSTGTRTRRSPTSGPWRTRRPGPTVASCSSTRPSSGVEVQDLGAENDPGKMKEVYRPLVKQAARGCAVWAHAHTVNVPVFPDPARGLEQDVCGKRAPQMTGLAGSGPRRRSKWCSGRAV